jgi:UDP-3-O-[3-hydroxymyristoyl] glucosamine N-acyltransferase
MASIVVVPERPSAIGSATVLLSAEPRLAFARIAALFECRQSARGIAASAVIDDQAGIAPSAGIGSNAVIGAARLGDNVEIGPGSVLGDRVSIGNDTVIGANAVLLPGTRVGARVRIGAGAVVGERGFGLVPGPQGFESVPQLGGVRIADDVEIGANSTIDRGTIEDTCLDTGVKIDNQVHIAHNCTIGAHTVVAGCTGIAGSCIIGKHCMIGGGVGIGDHVTIADEVVITAASQVPKSIEAKGIYSSTLRAMPARRWHRRLALLRALDRIEARLARVEAKNKVAGDN